MQGLGVSFFWVLFLGVWVLVLWFGFWVRLFVFNAEILACFIVFPLVLASIQKLSSCFFLKATEDQSAVSWVWKFCFQWSVFPSHVSAHKIITICIS